MALVILTKSPRANFFSKEFHKGWLRKIIKKDRGPKAVTASLLRGLNELGFAYKLNPKIREIGAHDTLWINESLDALGWAIHFKGKENTLIVGPNLVITPLDHKEILCDKAIDIILQPSAWTKDFMIMVKPELKDKLRIWPAGVAVPETKNIGKSIDMLVYTKNNAEKKLMDRIILSLKEKKLAFDIIDYGAFKQEIILTSLRDQDPCSIFPIPSRKAWPFKKHGQEMSRHLSSIADILTTSNIIIRMKRSARRISMTKTACSLPRIILMRSLRSSGTNLPHLRREPMWKKTFPIACAPRGFWI